MPSKTKKQRRAMRAAASGEGKLGISQKVAKEFVREDRKKARQRRKQERKRK